MTEFRVEEGVEESVRGGGGGEADGRSGRDRECGFVGVMASRNDVKEHEDVGDAGGDALVCVWCVSVDGASRARSSQQAAKYAY